MVESNSDRHVDNVDTVEADSRLIHWLLHESGETRYAISKAIGISESTLSRIASGETPMNAVRFGFAHKLTEYARTIKADASQEESVSTSALEGGTDA